MKKAPKVLTRMRLSCCWGDNLNVKELNDVVDYINELERQCKKQKEVIDKITDIINDYLKEEYSIYAENEIEVDLIAKLKDILKR